MSNRRNNSSGRGSATRFRGSQKETGNSLRCTNRSDGSSPGFAAEGAAVIATVGRLDCFHTVETDYGSWKLES